MWYSSPRIGTRGSEDRPLEILEGDSDGSLLAREP